MDIIYCAELADIIDNINNNQDLFRSMVGDIFVNNTFIFKNVPDCLKKLINKKKSIIELIDFYDGESVYTDYNVMDIYREQVQIINGDIISFLNKLSEIEVINILIDNISVNFNDTIIPLSFLIMNEDLRYSILDRREKVLVK